VLSGEPDDEGYEGYPAPNLLVYDPSADRWEGLHAYDGFERPLVAAGDALVLWGGFDGTNLMNDGVAIPLPVAPE
jgi:hypothetical protein